MGRVLRGLIKWKPFLIVFLTPLILLPIALQNSKAAKCAYGVLVIGVYWVMEVMPLAVTSLLPVVLFPMLGVMEVKKICTSYFKDTLMLFLGSLIVAVAVERWDLHRRIALRALTLVGPKPKWLILGIMFPCWFLSMWMSNTATAAMMVPILNAILSQIKAAREVEVLTDRKPKSHKSSKNGVKDIDKMVNGQPSTIEMQSLMKDEAEVQIVDGPGDTKDKEFLQLAKTFSLCVAFSANIGGTGTLTGTPPNIVFKGIADNEFEKYGIDSGITFANWLLIGLPLSVICFIFLWLWMQFYFSGIKCFACKKGSDDSYANVKAFLQREYCSLGKMTFAETLVLADFVILALLWITRDPQFIPGWGALFPKGFVQDSVAAILMSALLFVLPSKPPGFMCGKKQLVGTKLKNADFKDDEDLNNEVKIEIDMNTDDYVPLLTWKVVHEKLSWGVLLLMGGGFALADACQASGLSKVIGEHLTALSVLPSWGIVIVLTFVVAAVTNITSNSATTSLFVPIVFSLALELNVHPLYFMIPVTICASFAFLLPVGTPPNAIVFATGYLTVKDMVFGGAVVNLITILLLNIALNAYISPFLGLSEFPAQFRRVLAANSSVMGNSSFIDSAVNVSIINYSIVP